MWQTQGASRAEICHRGPVFASSEQNQTHKSWSTYLTVGDLWRLQEEKLT
jgi:hypothetical protein